MAHRYDRRKPGPCECERKQIVPKSYSDNVKRCNCSFKKPEETYNDRYKVKRKSDLLKNNLQQSGDVRKTQAEAHQQIEKANFNKKSCTRSTNVRHNAEEVNNNQPKVITGTSSGTLRKCLTALKRFVQYETSSFDDTNTDSQKINVDNIKRNTYEYINEFNESEDLHETSNNSRFIIPRDTDSLEIILSEAPNTKEKRRQSDLLKRNSCTRKTQATSHLKFEEADINKRQCTWKINAGHDTGETEAWDNQPRTITGTNGGTLNKCLYSLRALKRIIQLQYDNTLDVRDTDLQKNPEDETKTESNKYNNDFNENEYLHQIIAEEKKVETCFSNSRIDVVEEDSLEKIAGDTPKESKGDIRANKYKYNFKIKQKDSQSSFVDINTEPNYTKLSNDNNKFKSEKEASQESLAGKPKTLSSTGNNKSKARRYISRESVGSKKRAESKINIKTNKDNNKTKSRREISAESIAHKIKTESKVISEETRTDNIKSKLKRETSQGSIRSRAKPGSIITIKTSKDNNKSKTIREISPERIAHKTKTGERTSMDNNKSKSNKETSRRSITGRADTESTLTTKTSIDNNKSKMRRENSPISLKGKRRTESKSSIKSNTTGDKFQAGKVGSQLSIAGKRKTTESKLNIRKNNYNDKFKPKGKDSQGSITGRKRRRETESKVNINSNANDCQSIKDRRRRTLSKTNIKTNIGDYRCKAMKQSLQNSISCKRGTEAKNNFDLNKKQGSPKTSTNKKKDTEGNKSNKKNTLNHTFTELHQSETNAIIEINTNTEYAGEEKNKGGKSKVENTSLPLKDNTSVMKNKQIVDKENAGKSNRNLKNTKSSDSNVACRKCCGLETENCNAGINVRVEVNTNMCNCATEKHLQQTNHSKTKYAAAIPRTSIESEKKMPSISSEETTRVIELQNLEMKCACAIPKTSIESGKKMLSISSGETARVRERQNSETKRASAIPKRSSKESGKDVQETSTKDAKVATELLNSETKRTSVSPKTSIKSSKEMPRRSSKDATIDTELQNSEAECKCAISKTSIESGKKMLSISSEETARVRQMQNSETKRASAIPKRSSKESDKDVQETSTKGTGVATELMNSETKRTSVSPNTSIKSSKEMSRTSSKDATIATELQNSETESTYAISKTSIESGKDVQGTSRENAKPKDQSSQIKLIASEAVITEKLIENKSGIFSLIHGEDNQTEIDYLNQAAEERSVQIDYTESGVEFLDAVESTQESFFSVENTEDDKNVDQFEDRKSINYDIASSSTDCEIAGPSTDKKTPKFVIPSSARALAQGLFSKFYKFAQKLYADKYNWQLAKTIAIYLLALKLTTECFALIFPVKDNECHYCET